jgi:hypothetical protein
MKYHAQLHRVKIFGIHKLLSYEIIMYSHAIIRDIDQFGVSTAHPNDADWNSGSVKMCHVKILSYHLCFHLLRFSSSDGCEGVDKL